MYHEPDRSFDLRRGATGRGVGGKQKLGMAGAFAGELVPPVWIGAVIRGLAVGKWAVIPSPVAIDLLPVIWTALFWRIPA